MCSTWLDTVFGVTNSLLAISLFEWPRARSDDASTSRAVSPPGRYRGASAFGDRRRRGRRPRRRRPSCRRARPLVAAPPRSPAPSRFDAASAGHHVVGVGGRQHPIRMGELAGREAAGIPGPIEAPRDPTPRGHAPTQARGFRPHASGEDKDAGELAARAPWPTARPCPRWRSSRRGGRGRGRPGAPRRRPARRVTSRRRAPPRRQRFATRGVPREVRRLHVDPGRPSPPGRDQARRSFSPLSSPGSTSDPGVRPAGRLVEAGRRLRPRACRSSPAGSRSKLSLPLRSSAASRAPRCRHGGYRPRRCRRDRRSGPQAVCRAPRCRSAPLPLPKR